MYISMLFILATSGQVNFQSGPMGEITFLSITFEPKVIDECNLCLNICLVASN